MQTNKRTRAIPTTPLVVIVAAYLMFMVLGFPDGMLGVAWPSMMADFAVQNAQMGTMLLAATIGFLITSFNTGRLIRWFGISTLLVGSSVVRAMGLLSIALAPQWLALVAAAFVFGVGSGAIDGGMNTFFAMRVRSPRLMNWLHASFGLGATIAPIMLTALFGLGVAWRWGYVIVALLQLAMGLVVFLRAGDWRMEAAESETPIPAARRSTRATLARPIVWVNIAIFFFYAGIEVTAGNWSYSIFTETRGVAPEVAGLMTGLYWGSFTVGRVFFGIVANRFAVVPTIRAMAVTGIAAAALFWWNPVNWVGFAGLLILGFALAPVFPLLMTATPLRLGNADANNAIGFQVAAASFGIGVLPGIAGALADRVGLEIVGPFMVVGLISMAVLHEVAVRSHRE
ncbi:MAG TPA: MFS transporter [Chloroflexi bacterium]|nr:MFS transporter [Chloroflexota bacterium]HHW84743.1 MFS transporter [Chloroflexota bacterium]